MRNGDSGEAPRGSGAAAAAAEIRFLGPRQWAAAARRSVSGADAPVRVTRMAGRCGRASLTRKCSRQAPGPALPAGAKRRWRSAERKVVRAVGLSACS